MAAVGETPAYMQYPEMGTLVDYPTVDNMEHFLLWLRDRAGIDSFVDDMTWYGPGFYGLVVAREIKDGIVVGSTQLNMYDSRYPGNDEPHDHSRSSKTQIFMPFGAHQITTTYGLILPESPVVDGVPALEVGVIGNIIGDRGDGKKPAYNPIGLGDGLLQVLSSTAIREGGREFGPLEIHAVSVKGLKRAYNALSLHTKGPERPLALSTDNAAMIGYLGLSQEWAEKLVASRLDLEEILVGRDGVVRLGPTTRAFTLDGRQEGLGTNDPRVSRDEKAAIFERCMATVHWLVHNSS